MKSETADKVIEYDIMRVVLTVMIVADHALYLAMPFGFGGVDYTASLGNCMGTGFYQMLNRITVFFVFFQMPAFFFLSGAVFCLGMKQDKYPDLGVLVENKAKRLIYPALMAGVFWMVPLKFFGNGYSSAKVLPYAVFKGVILCQAGLGHLWYLFTLFWIFLISYLCLKYLIKESRKVFFVLFFLLGTFYSIIEMNLPGAVMLSYYLLFFGAGCCFEHVRKNIVGHRGLLWISLAAAFAVAAAAYHFTASVVTTGMFWRDWLKTLGIIACIIIVFILCHFLANLHVARLALYKILEKHSFYIYLLHDPVNYIVLAAFARLVQRIGGGYPVNWTAVGIGLAACRILGNIIICITASVFIRKIQKIKFVRAGWLLVIVCLISLVILFYNDRHGITVVMNAYKI